MFFQSCRANGMTCMVKYNRSDNIPPLGSMITVKHNGAYTTGTLKNPVYWRATPSLVGTKVCYDGRRLNELNWNIKTEHKKIFDHLAKVFQISQPTDWYRVKRDDIHKHGWKSSLQRYYNNSLYTVHDLLGRFHF